MLLVCSSPCLGLGHAQHTDYASATSVLFPLLGSRLECVVLVWLEKSRPPNLGTSCVEGVPCPPPICLVLGQAQHTDYDSATSVLLRLPGSRQQAQHRDYDSATSVLLGLPGFKQLSWF